MRFCLQETSCEQEDYFPPNIGVKVNGKICPLPVSSIGGIYKYLFQNSTYNCDNVRCRKY